MNEEILAPWRVDHLLVLEGSNPLPNRVAIPSLLKPGGRVTLLCSGGKKSSRPAADRLRRVLAAQQIVRVEIARDLDAWNPADIVRVASEVAVAKQGERLGLHYTAGTKAMVVHCYRAVERAAPDAVFSYLSPGDKLVVHDADPTLRQETVSVRDVVVPLRELLHLHGGVPLDGAPRETEPLFPELARALALYNAENHHTGEWSEWRRTFLPRPDRPDEVDGSRRVDWTALPEPVCRALPAEIADAPTLDAAARNCSVSTKTLVEYLNGVWLEDYTLSCLIDAAKKVPLRDLYRGLTLDYTNIEGAERFEVDATAVRGHRLYLFSCSVESTVKGSGSRPKHKLFEAMERARQMGGDEARAVLVSCLHPLGANATQKEAQRVLHIGDRVRVFGRKDLPNLAKSLATWMGG